MSVNWELGIAPPVMGNALAAYDEGQKTKAFAEYAKNPDSPDTLNGLARFDPRFVVEQKQNMAKSRQLADEKQLLGDALANPDPAARAAARQRLAYTNSEEYHKLSDEDKRRADAGYEYIGQHAFRILQLPEDQQGPALQQALQSMPGVAANVDMSQGPKQILLNALAKAKMLDKWEQFSKPTYTPVGERGLAGFQFGQPIAGADGRARDFGPEAPPGVTFTPIQSAPVQGGPVQSAPGTFRP